MRFRQNGWYRESYRHALAAKGISTRKIRLAPQQLHTIEQFENMALQMESQKLKEENPEMSEEEIKRTAKARVDTFKDTLEAQKQVATKYGLRTVRETEAEKQRAIADPFETFVINLNNSGLRSLKFNPETGTTFIPTAAGEITLEELQAQSPTRAEAFKTAVYSAASKNIERGDQVDYQFLERLGMTKLRLEALKARERQIKTGTPETRTERALEATGEFAKATGKLVVKEAKAAGRYVQGKASEFIDLSEPTGNDLVANTPNELLEGGNRGAFDPLRIVEEETGGKPIKLFGALSPDNDQNEIPPERLYPTAILSSQLAATIDQSGSKMADFDKSYYNKGKNAYKNGDIPKLLRAIAGLESQKAKLNSNWNMVQKARKYIESDNNLTESTVMEKSVNPVSLFAGSTGGGKIADETRKVAKTEKKIADNINDVSRRLGELRVLAGRLSTLNNIHKEVDLPEAKEYREYDSGGDFDIGFSLIDAIDDGSGSLKGYNPVLAPAQQAKISMYYKRVKRENKQ